MKSVVLLYRYRPIETGLKELQNFSIYFSPVSKLNDPIGEGEFNVYWQGDSIAWSGLLRNYICSMFIAMEHFLLGVNRNDIQKYAAIVDIHMFDDVPMGKRLSAIQEKFLMDEKVKAWLDMVSHTNDRIYEHTLALLLTQIHGIALNIVLEQFVHDKVINQNVLDQQREYSCKRQLPLSDFKFLVQKILNTVDDEAKKCLNNKKNAAFFVEMNSNEREKALFDICASFPNFYVKHLQEILYPNSYIACFTGNPNNKVMWGNYAGAQQGICMIYETDDKNRISLTDKDDHTHNDYLIEQVLYDDNLEEDNFFELLGMLNPEQLFSWLTAPDGEKSDILNCYYPEKQKWRDRYWGIFHKRFFRKATGWSYEQESRVVIADLFLNQGNDEGKLLEVDSKNVYGVILGMKVEKDRKKEIIKRVIELRKDERFKNFKIFQEDKKLDGELYPREMAIYPELEKIMDDAEGR